MGEPEKKLTTSNGKLLSLDLSTTCTGYAIFTLSGTLLEYGKIVPKAPKGPKGYPEEPLRKMRALAEAVLAQIAKVEGLEIILLEEINRGIGRMSQKTLDGAHFVLLHFMDDAALHKVIYMDSDGPNGWRTYLGLKLEEGDRIANKEHKRLNKLLRKGQPKFHVVDKKELACRYVNARLGTNFDVLTNKTDADIVDSIGLGMAYLSKHYGQPK